MKNLKISTIKMVAPVKEHSVMQRPGLAWTFREIARNGEDAFYKGSIAKKIVKAMQQNGGYISQRRP